MPPASPADDRRGEAVPAESEERRWVEAARAGDREAFGHLAEAYGDLVNRVIGRLVRDPDDRADLVQETFYRAVKALDRFRPGAAFRPWIVTIALNAARDELRARARHREVSLDDPETGVNPERELAGELPAPDQLAAASELSGRIEAAFAQLEPQAQTILWLRVREELSYAEIATVLGVAVGTVMSRLARARRALRDQLAAMGGPPEPSGVRGGDHDR
jgi:RNA polymerase sigma-70 factor (ECF subfamily)